MTEPNEIMAASRIVVLAVLLHVLSLPAEAQRWEVGLAGARVDAGSAGTGSSGSIVSLLEWRKRSVFASVNAGVTAFAAGGWSSQGSADASYFISSPGSHLAGEFVVALEGTHRSSDFRTSAVRIEPRLHVMESRRGAWLGGAFAAGRTTGDIANSGIGPSAGAWVRRGTVRGAVTFTPLYVDDAWYPEVDGYLAITAGPIDAVGYAGWRGADDLSSQWRGAWGGAAASWWFGPRSAVTVAGGSFPADLLQNLAAASYVSIGIRLTNYRPAVPILRPIGRPVYERESEGRLRLQFRVPDATSVAVAGDWTDWHQVPMERASGDTWELVMTVPPGVHRFNLVVDGERWIVPPDVPRVSDGFGGTAGLLVVP